MENDTKRRFWRYHIIYFVAKLSFNNSSSLSGLSATSGSYSCSYSYGYYEGYCQCIVTNKSNYTYTYVSIEFGLYDSNGYLLDTALDTTTNLSSNETWNVAAYYMFSSNKGKPASAKIIKLNGW